MRRYLLLFILCTSFSYSQSYALQFHGIDDIVQLPDMGAPLSDFTIEIIVEIDELNGTESIVSHEWWGGGAFQWNCE